jgi:ribosome-binding ATPase
MIIGIVGLAKSGKTTVFNAITGAAAQTSAYASEDSANIAMVKVPEKRIDELHKFFKNPKKVFVELKFMDFAPFHKGMGEKGFPAKHIGDLRTADALVMVVRAFENETVPHPENRIDAAKDAENLLTELGLADLDVVEHRIARIDEQIQRTKKEDRGKMEREKELMLQFKDKLEDGGMIDEVEMNEEDLHSIRSYGFLTQKPLICVVNVHEKDISNDMVSKVRSVLPSNIPAIQLAGQAEMDIAALEESEQKEFMEDLGITEPAKNLIIRTAWDRLGLIVFFTVGDDECRAWPIKSGDTALIAASKIHSDIARGFIRGEVVPYADFMAHNGMAGVKKAGLMRLESKEYIVKDGEIVHFRFNI